MQLKLPKQDFEVTMDQHEKKTLEHTIDILMDLRNYMGITKNPYIRCENNQLISISAIQGMIQNLKFLGTIEGVTSNLTEVDKLQ